MRNGKLALDVMKSKTIRELKQEAEYYQVQSLLKYLAGTRRARLTPFSSSSSPPLPPLAGCSCCLSVTAFSTVYSRVVRMSLFLCLDYAENYRPKFVSHESPCATLSTDGSTAEVKQSLATHQSKLLSAISTNCQLPRHDSGYGLLTTSTLRCEPVEGPNASKLHVLMHFSVRVDTADAKGAVGFMIPAIGHPGQLLVIVVVDRGIALP
jgi:hypothetical protein